MTALTMYDSIDPSQIPADAAVVAGYTGGSWPTYASLATRFPHARRVSIAVTASADADFLDIENGDATVGSAAGWYARQRARGVTRPGFYASASTMAASLIPAYQAAGISRRSLRLWSAHYGSPLGPHICGPVTCGLVPVTMDATQLTDVALGRNLDASLLAASFFGTSPPLEPHMEITKPPPGNWEGPVIVLGKGADGNLWETKTADGKTWTTPVKQ